MPSSITRRDFLKLAGAASLIPLLSQAKISLFPNQAGSPGSPNIIIIVFDALSALHLSLYGYARKTSPNMERLAQRSSVYHAHHSAANFTAPSTTSLFTGVYPWLHRVFSLNGLIARPFRAQNLWQYTAGAFYQAAMLQNMYADILLYQLKERLDRHIGPDEFNLVGSTFYNRLFTKDAVYGAKTYDQFLFDPKEKPGSLLLSVPIDLLRQFGKAVVAQRLAKTYPEGLPFLDGAETYFSIEQVMQGAQGLLDSLPQPFLAYLHFMPPHAPYRPERGFLGTFDDGWKPPKTKNHKLSSRRSPEHLDKQRQRYDEYIANLDEEFGRLLDHLESSGLLDNSYLMVTSDHGDLFGWGEQGHVTPLLFEPVIRIPLIISAPGQSQRRDIRSVTSNVDVLPTVLHLSGLEVPAVCEGQVLPGLGGDETTQRAIFAVEAKRNPAYEPLRKASLAMIRGRYKLVRYMGYGKSDGYEFYDLEEDPGEMQDQYGTHPLAQEMQGELDAKLAAVNQPYLPG
jgi:arylsulfatase A-like enzyme